MGNTNKATIYDLKRMCKSYKTCEDCELAIFSGEKSCPCFEDIDKVSDIILEWCKKHPIKTRQDEFLKLFPNAELSQFSGGAINICPKRLDTKYSCPPFNYNCFKCLEDYWLAETNEVK